MNASNISIITVIIVLMSFTSLCIALYGNVKEYEMTEKYKNKVEFALASSMTNKFDNLNDKDISNMSIGDVNKFNEESMFNNFIKMLNNNFSLDDDEPIMKDYLDKYIILYNDGLIYNFKNSEDKREWSLKVPYTINYNDTLYTFNLDDDDLIINNINIKSLAIVGTLRRNIIIEDKNSITINIPFKDNKYKTINNKTVIATFLDVPIVNNKKVNIAVTSGSEIKSRNVYFINENNKYEKINPNNITSDMITFYDKKEAGKYYYPQI